MFCEEQDAHSTLWEGPRTGTDAAVRKFGADDVSTPRLPLPFLICNQGLSIRQTAKET